MLKRHFICCALAFSAALSFASGLRAEEGGGPTPFPKDHSLFPGQGVVRVFPWMVDNRNWFWTKRAEAQNAVVFTGDSLVGNWGNVSKAFPKMKVANRGIGGDVTRGLLFRFQEDILDLHPKAIVILIGTNDLSAKEPPADALANIGAMLDMTLKAAPTVPVVLCTVPPRESKEAPIDNSQLLELNQGLAGLAKGRADVTLLDLYPLFVMPDGSGAPDPQYFRKDKLHFGAPGYDKWAAALRPVFEKLNVE